MSLYWTPMAVPSTSKPEGSEGHTYTQRAGLVLTWPYLERLFETREALEAPGKRQRLLGYLATGLSDLTEADPLEALLAEAEADTAMPDPELWTAEDAELCEGLLHAITQNWPPLQDTSIEGLRETFLIRPGRLTELQGRTQLVVEKGPFDMLLDQLPWSISTIHPSWMAKPLMVKWR